jgi:hypothetical protein
MNVRRSALGRLISISCGVGLLVATLASPAAASYSSTASWTQPVKSVWVDNAGSIVTVTSTTVEKRNASNGSVVWTRNIDPAYGHDFSLHLVFDSANNMYLTGHLDDRVVQTNVSVVKISSGGTILWSRKHPIGGIGQTEHMDEGPMLIARNGNLYIVAREGQLVNPPNGYIAKLFRINTSTGSLINSRMLPNTFDAGGGGMRDTALAADSNSNIYYGCASGLFKFSADLAPPNWQFTTPVRAVVVDRWNNLYVTGLVLSSPPLYSMYVAQISSQNGAALWTNVLPPNATTGTYQDPFDPTNQDERTFGGNAIALDSHGYVWAGGRGSQAGGWDGGYVAKFEPVGGRLLWSHLYGDNNASGAVLSMAIDDTDNVFVTGMRGRQDPLVPRPTLVDVLGSVADDAVSQTFGPGNPYQENSRIVVDKKGQMYWLDYTGGPGFGVFSAQVKGRQPTAIATLKGNGKSKVLMGTLDHQNIQLLTLSAADVLQAGNTNWSYGTYGRRDVDISAGPDNRVRILQQLDFNGTTSAAVQVLVRDDAGNLITPAAAARNVTNLRALKIATASDNKSYVLLESTVDASCQVWRMDANGAFEASATFTTQASRAPAEIAVDGTSIVYLIWQDLDRAVFPWRLNTSLTVTNQTAVYDMQAEPTSLLVGADVGADHQLRLFFDLGGTGQRLVALNSSGGFIRIVSQPTFGATGISLSVGSDNRSHMLNTEFGLDNWLYAVANTTLTQTSLQTFAIPAN